LPEQREGLEGRRHQLADASGPDFLRSLALRDKHFRVTDQDRATQENFMTRCVLLTTILLTLSAAPAAADNCYWSNGVYRCKDRSGKTYVVKPQAEQGWQQQQRRSQGAMRGPAYVPPPDYGTGMGAFSYGCTMSRCD
jgi:hypothetical protein